MNELEDIDKIDKMVAKSSLLPDFMRNKFVINSISVIIVLFVCFITLKLVHKIIRKFFNSKKIKE